MGLSTGILQESLGRIAAKVEMAADELNALDAKIGDGDLGVTLNRCARPS
jgi:phosphoenolpyruvate---glycerone phosphotransferase subunit DhaL